MQDANGPASPVIEPLAHDHSCCR